LKNNFATLKLQGYHFLLICSSTKVQAEEMNKFYKKKRDTMKVKSTSKIQLLLSSEINWEWWRMNHTKFKSNCNNAKKYKNLNKYLSLRLDIFKIPLRISPSINKNWNCNSILSKFKITSSTIKYLNLSMTATLGLKKKVNIRRQSKDFRRKFKYLSYHVLKRLKT